MKPMTAAEYAAHSDKVKSQRPTELLQLKSGAVFEVRKINLKEMVQLGIIPQALVTESMRAMRNKGYKMPETPEVQSDGLILQREVVAALCVMPPFNEITARSFTEEDFTELYAWGMSHQGVENAKALTTFRKGRKRRAAGDRSDGSELQPEAVSTASN